MKTFFYTLAICAGLMTAACSKESLIEGQIETRPAVVVLNQEIARGTSGQLSIISGDKTYLVTCSYGYSPVSGGTNIYQRSCSVNSTTSATGYIAFARVVSTPWAKDSNEGDRIDSAAITYPSTMVTLLACNSPANTTQYTYVSQNRAKLDQAFYVPVRLLPPLTAATSTGMLGWMQFTITAEKMIVHKLVYKNYGSIKVGEE